MRIADTFHSLPERMYAIKERAKDFGKGVADYVKVGPLYHSLSVATMPIVGAWYSITPQATGEKIAGSLMIGLPVLYLQYLATRRFREYNRIKSVLQEHGYDERIVGQHLKWFCDRHATGVAAKETGYKEKFKQTLREHGVRWYQPAPKPSEWLKAASKDPILQSIRRKIKSKRSKV